MIWASGAISQEMPLYGLYLHNYYFLNPAAAGSSTMMPVTLATRQLWAGIEDAPTTYAFSINKRLVKTREKNIMLKNGHGVGGNIFSHNKGGINLTGIQLSYAFHIAMRNKQQLALGISGSFSSYGLNISASDFGSPNDKVLEEGYMQDKMIPDADFGVYYYTPTLRLGLIAAQLMRSSVTFDEMGTIDDRNARKFYLTANYVVFDRGYAGFEPSAALVVKQGSEMEIGGHVTAKVFFRRDLKKFYEEEKVSLLVSYRLNEAFIAQVSLEINKFYVGYAYEYTTSSIMDYTHGSHQLSIGLNIGSLRRK